MRVIVSILSDQPIPVVLFIKQIAKASDRHIFLSTKEMEAKHKSATIAFALGLGIQHYQVIQIDANNPALILEILDQYEWPEGEKYLVNITGGTKMMSQMTYLHFSEKRNTEIYYWPIGGDTLERLHPTIESVKPSNPIQIDLQTYFLAHGFEHKAQTQFSNPFKRTQGIFNACITAGSAAFVDEISQAKSPHYTGHEKGYLAGGWFEEWIYGTLKDALTLPDTSIAYNIKLKNKYSLRNTDSDNEVDVAFVYKNRLFMWECKVYSMTIINPRKITEAVYKISSVSRALGLQATSIVCILAPFGANENRKAFISDISDAMRVTRVLGLEDMMNKNDFINKIKKIIGYGT